MIGSILKFGDIDLSKKGVIEKAEYEDLSINPITLSRALLPDYYYTRKRNIKEIGINFRYIHNSKDNRKIENILEYIIGSLYEEEKALLQINDKYCEALLIGAKKTVQVNTGFIELKFINLDGVFYGELLEKKGSSSKPITILNDGIIASDEVIIIAECLDTNIKITNGTKSINVKDNKVGDFIKIDLKNKTVKSGDRHLNMDLFSDFFNLKKGENNILANGCNVDIKYRKVVAL